MMMNKVENTLVDLMGCLARCEGIDPYSQQDILILMARLEGMEPRPQPDNKEGDWCSVGKRVYIKADPENARIQWDIDQIHEDKGVLISSILGRYWKCRTELEPVVNTLSNARAPKKGQGLPPLRSKDGEGVEWDGEGLPPVGAMVDIEGHGLVYGDGESGEVLGHIEGTAIVRMSYGLGCFEARVLKPLKSHRDKCIKAAMRLFDRTEATKDAREGIEHAVETLAKADMLRLPNDKEGNRSNEARLLAMLDRVVTEEAVVCPETGELGGSQEEWIRDAIELINDIEGQK